MEISGRGNQPLCKNDLWENTKLSSLERFYHDRNEGFRGRACFKFFGVLRMPRIEMYWSSKYEELYTVTPGISGIMSVCRLEQFYRISMLPIMTARFHMDSQGMINFSRFDHLDIVVRFLY